MGGMAIVRPPGPDAVPGREGIVVLIDMLLIDVEFVDWERGGGGRGKGVIDTRLCRNK